MDIFYKNQELYEMLGDDYILFRGMNDRFILMRTDAAAFVDFRYDDTFEHVFIDEFDLGLPYFIDMDTDVCNEVIDKLEEIVFHEGVRRLFAKDDYGYGRIFKDRGYVVGGKYEDGEDSCDLLVKFNPDIEEGGGSPEEGK